MLTEANLGTMGVTSRHMVEFARPLFGSLPKLVAPGGTVDTHMHIISDAYPQSAAGPRQMLAPLEDYALVQERLGIRRAVIVQPNAYQHDNRCLEATLMALGSDARGVAVILPDVEDAELERLHHLGVRGARIMDIGPGAVSSDHLLAISERIAPLGWHPIVQFNGRQIADYEQKLSAVSGPYVIDHAGKFIPPVAPESAEFKTLLRLVDRGNCYVKLSACYETSQVGAPGYDDVGALSSALARHAPERMLWASNWPHVSATPEMFPDDVRILDVLLDWVPDAEDRRMILQDNPTQLYGFDPFVG